MNGSAQAPADFTALSSTITFPAESKAAIKVKVVTKANTALEPIETFSLQVGTSTVVLRRATATIAGGATTTTTTTRPSAVCPSGSTPTTPLPGAPSSPSTQATLLPPAGVTGGAQWDLMFDDEFSSATTTASKWESGMRTGGRTLEGNGELQWYLPANSAVTTDNDGFGTVGVLRQTLKQQVVPSETYTFRTLSRIYPPSACASLYDPKVNNSCHRRTRTRPRCRTSSPPACSTIRRASGSSTATSRPG